jgi:RNA polymerase sigma-70 factor (ECF subfamily)
VQELDAHFTAWFDQILPRVLHLARRTAASREEAEDVAGEALVRAYANWPKLRALPYRDGWLIRTVTNLSIDAGRRRSRSPWQRLFGASSTARPGAGDGDGDDAATATGTAVDDEVVNRRALTGALAKLPARQREAVTLRYLAGYSVAEAAQAMRLGEDTVRTHLHRGLAAMRLTLADDVEDRSGR